MTRARSTLASLVARMSFAAFVAFVPLVSLALTCAPSVARAQTKPDLRASVSSDVVELGDTVDYTLQAMSTGEAPGTADHGAIPGFVERGHTLIPSHSIAIVNGVRTERRGATVTWQIQATRTGTFKLGPAIVTVGGKRFAAQPVTIRVVPPGQAPPRPSARDPFGTPFSTFDPWKNMFKDRDRDRDEEPRQPNVPTDSKLGMDAPRGQTAFLHAIIDKTNAVVGEQVTLSLYVYLDATAASVEFTDPHEATVSDYIKQPLVADDAETKHAGFALVGGKLWSARLVRKWALFPLKAGDLEIGSMSVTIARPRVAGSPVRQSEPLRVKVTEPPIAGRPPGYVVGDVGSFTLSADVQPRDIDQDAAIAVNVELSGSGNLPTSLTPPTREGLEWLEPQVRSDVGAMQDERFGGKRTFAYVVRVHKAGTVDLGEVSAPYWNPDTKSYGVARAALGVVRVRARPDTPRAASSSEGPAQVLADLPALREKRADASAPRAHLTDSPAPWLLLGASPLAYVVAFGATAAARRLRAKKAERAASPARELKERMATGDSAARGDDARAIDGATVKAIEAASLARANVNVRGARAEEVAARLEGGGIPKEIALAIQDLLRECEDVRFSPEAPTAEAARARWERAREAIATLKVNA